MGVPTASRKPRGQARWALLLVSGGMIATIAGYAWLKHEPNMPSTQEMLDSDQLVTPRAPDDDRIRDRSFDPRTLSGPPEGREGRITMTRDGRLAQRYEFANLDPAPPGMPEEWALMTRPRAEIYGDDGRVTVMSGDSALVHLPNRMLESGTLTGNVVIELYELESLRPLDRTRDVPVLIVNTEEAQYEDMIGSVECPGDIHAESPQWEYAGSDLSMLINDENQSVEATIQETIFLRVVGARNTPGDGAATPQPPPATVTDGSSSSPTPPPAPPPAPTPAPGETGPPMPDEETIIHYVLTLADDVVVRSGTAAAERTLEGDMLSFFFTNKSEGLERADTPTRTSAAPPAASGVPLSPRAAIAAAIIMLPTSELRLAPPPAEEDIWITCSGPMRLGTLDELPAILTSPLDAAIDMPGTPLTLRDLAQGARVTCARMQYGSLSGRLQLVGSDAYPLVMKTPRLEANGARFWLEPRTGLGGFEDAGWLVTTTDTDPGGSMTDGQAFEISWADHVDLVFEPTGDDTLGPLRSAQFTDGVEVVRDQVTLWASGVLATFKQPAPEKASGAEQNVLLETFRAEGDVQASLADGGRVFADTMQGVAESELIEMTGDDVAVVYEQWALDQGKRLIANGRGEAIDWEGPGRARLFAEPVFDPRLAAGRPIHRPTLGNEAQMTAYWSDALAYRRLDSVRESVLLTGDVEVLNTPSPNERNTVHASAVTLELTEAPEVVELTGDVSVDADTPRTRRVLDRVLAAGDARIEGRTWVEEDADAPPSIFFLHSEEIEYHPVTGEGSVPGAGTLLIRDTSTETDAAEGDTNESAGPWQRGTTSFRWARSLEMSRIGETNRFEIDMSGSVEMRHLSIQRLITTLTCDSVVAVVERVRVADTAPEADALAMKDSSELRSLRADGTVFLRTPERDVDCDHFTYDLETGKARLIASPGRLVTIYTPGEPQPAQFTEAEWDLATDAITVVRGSGGIGVRR